MTADYEWENERWLDEGNGMKPAAGGNIPAYGKPADTPALFGYNTEQLLKSLGIVPAGQQKAASPPGGAERRFQPPGVKVQSSLAEIAAEEAIRQEKEKEERNKRLEEIGNAVRAHIRGESQTPAGTGGATLPGQKPGESNINAYTMLDAIKQGLKEAGDLAGGVAAGFGEMTGKRWRESN